MRAWTKAIGQKAELVIVSTFFSSHCFDACDARRRHFSFRTDTKLQRPGYLRCLRLASRSNEVWRVGKTFETAQLASRQDGSPRECFRRKRLAGPDDPSRRSPDNFPKHFPVAGGSGTVELKFRSPNYVLAYPIHLLKRAADPRHKIRSSQSYPFNRSHPTIMTGATAPKMKDII